MFAAERAGEPPDMACVARSFKVRLRMFAAERAVKSAFDANMRDPAFLVSASSRRSAR